MNEICEEYMSDRKDLIRKLSFTIVQVNWIELHLGAVDINYAGYGYLELWNLKSERNFDGTFTDIRHQHTVLESID